MPWKISLSDQSRQWPNEVALEMVVEETIKEMAYMTVKTYFGREDYYNKTRLLR